MLTTLAMFSTNHVRMASSVGGPEIGVTFLFFAIGPLVHLLCRLFVELRLLLLLGNFNSRSQTKLLHQADPEKIPAVQFENFSVLQQIADIGSPVRKLVMKKPSHVGMPKAAGDCADSGTIKMGRMGVALPVAVGMVAAMNGCPKDYRTL